MKKLLFITVVFISGIQLHAQVDCVVNEPAIVDSLSECGDALQELTIGDTLTVCLDSILYAETNGNLLDAVIPLFDTLTFQIIDATGPDNNWVFVDSLDGSAVGGIFYDENGDLDPFNDPGDDSCFPEACGNFCFDFLILGPFVDLECPLQGIFVISDFSTGGNPGGLPPLCDERDTLFTTLPIDLYYFRGSAEEHHNELRWASLYEINNEGYFLQRSFDGERFENLAFIEGQGTSYDVNTYTTQDDNPFSLAYYRLKQVDLDGSYAYSNIIAIKREDKEIHWNEIQVYPNPGHDFITIDFNHERFERIRISDISGQILIDRALDTESAFELVDIQCLSNGLYIIQFFGEYYKTVPFTKQERF